MLEIMNVSKSYKNKEVLKNISFKLLPGEITSLIGNNGSGKTTTFKIMSGLLKADQGDLNQFNQLIQNKEIAYFPEVISLFADCDLYEHLKLIAKLNKRKNIDELIYYYLAKFSLEKEKSTPINKLSKGNQQKVGFICCLIKNPKLLILDEPFTGLDKDNIEIFNNFIELEKRKNKYIILSSHIYQPINQLCDHYLYLNDGQIKLDVTKNKLKNDNRKVIEVANSFALENDLFIKEIECEATTKYIVDKQNVNKVGTYLLNEKINFKISDLSIEEAIYL